MQGFESEPKIVNGQIWWGAEMARSFDEFRQAANASYRRLKQRQEAFGFLFDEFHRAVIEGLGAANYRLIDKGVLTYDDPEQVNSLDVSQWAKPLAANATFRLMFYFADNLIAYYDLQLKFVETDQGIQVVFLPSNEAVIGYHKALNRGAMDDLVSKIVDFLDANI